MKKEFFFAARDFKQSPYQNDDFDELEEHS
jgi:hypothetical protein